MIRSREEDDALRAMRAANPTSAEELRATIDEAELARAMRRAIVVGESPGQPIPAGDRVAIERGAGGPGRVGFFPRHRVAAVGFGIACAAVIAALLILGGGSVDSVKDGGRPTYAAAAVKVAEANPRLLITAPGWMIIHANITAEDGGLTYRKAGHSYPGPYAALMSWSPAALYRERLRELRVNRYRARTSVTHPTVAGRRVSAFHSRRNLAYEVVFPPQGDVFVTLSLPAVEHEALLRSVRAVGVDRWLAAMPPEVVQPVAESGVIAQMLHGVPLPPGFDPSTLEPEGELANRYDLGQTVAGAVTCGWLESWEAATRSGDEAAAEEAVEALSGARHWAVLLQMVHEKGYHGAELPAHGSGWPAYVVTAGREIAAGHLRRRPAVTRRYHQGALLGVDTPRNAAPASVLGCRLGE